MLQNYGKITWRSLAKNRVYSAINIMGLAIGMTVATLIGLWLWDELSFNQYHQNYNRLARVLWHVSREGDISTTFYKPDS
jgi:hypothetical protein